MARYNVLTPVAVLGAMAASPAFAQVVVNVGDTVDDGILLDAGENLTNSGTINNTANDTAPAVDNVGDLVGIITNNATGTITGTNGQQAISGSEIIGIVNSGLITSDGAQTIGAGATIGSFLNNAGATVSNTGSGNAIGVSDGFTTFTNRGTISAVEREAVGTTGSVGTFINSGTMSGGVSNTIGIVNGTDSFTNELGGVIENTNAGPNGGIAIGLGGAVGSFVNHGTIRGAGNMDESELRPTVVFYGEANQVGSFLNSGLVTGPGTGIAFDGGVDSFTNEAGGSIVSTMDFGVRSGGPVGTFVNGGTIRADGKAVLLDGGATSFTNESSGTISSENSAGLEIAFGVGSLVNHGSISTQSQSAALVVFGGVTSATNTGVISSPNGSGVRLQGGGGEFNNSGTITAGVDEGFYAVGGTSLTNSGTIATDGPTSFSALFDGGADDTLTILTGSELYGAVDFGAGDDTFDFSGFAGTAVIGVFGLEEDGIVSGSRTYATAGDLQTGGGIAIFDPTGTTAIGSNTGNIVGAIQSAIAGQIGGGGGGLPGEAMLDAFAPEPALGEAADATAVMSNLDVGAPSDMKVWGAAFGGGSYDDAPVELTHLYGGLVLGAHAALDAQHTLRGVGAYARSIFEVTGQQTITSDTGVLGAYGQSDLGVVKLDYSLLGGAGSHSSSRDVVVVNVLETLTGSFSSWFLAPSLGISLPVLADNGAEVNIAASASYIFGGVSSYTEESASLSIAVGAQDIGIFEGRLEINGKVAVAATDAGDVTLRGKAGLLVQANRGGSTMPITFAGSPGGNPLSASTSYTAPGTTTYGGYAGIGLSVPVATGVAVNFDAGGSVLDNGTTQAHASAGLSGSF